MTTVILRIRVYFLLQFHVTYSISPIQNPKKGISANATYLMVHQFHHRSPPHSIPSLPCPALALHLQ